MSESDPQGGGAEGWGESRVQAGGNPEVSFDLSLGKFGSWGTNVWTQRGKQWKMERVKSKKGERGKKKEKEKWKEKGKKTN